MDGIRVLNEFRDAQNSQDIRVIPRPLCLLCGTEGGRLYKGLVDWLFGVRGTWELRHCRVCEISWLDPQPYRDDIAKLYSQYYTHRGIPTTKSQRVQQAITNEVVARMGYEVKSRARLLPWLLSQVRPIARAAALDVLDLPASTRGALLDVGCGNGELLERMKSLGWRVSGVEPDPAAVAYGRSRGLQVLHGMISDVPADASYDVIAVNHVIEHVSDPIDLLRQCAKRLRPVSGRLIITTPNMKSLGHQLFKSYWRGLEVPRHLILFSPRGISECIRRAGLLVNSIQTETRMARMIYVPSVCAKAGQKDIGSRTTFNVTTKIAAYLFQAIEDVWICFSKDAGEEIFVCAARS